MPAVRICIATVVHERASARAQAGDLCERLVVEAGHQVVRRMVASDDPKMLHELVRDLSDANACDAILLLGGTGLRRHDRTCEAVEAIVDKRIEGFGERLRCLVAEARGSASMLARGTAGVFNGCVVFAMPSEPELVGAVMTKLILPVVGDAVDLSKDEVDPT